VKRSNRLGRVRVSADGEGVVSYAGAELLRELAGSSGLIDAWDAALIGTYKAIPIHFPGAVLADLAVAIADGADSISDLKALRDQPRPVRPGRLDADGVAGARPGERGTPAGVAGGAGGGERTGVGGGRRAGRVRGAVLGHRRHDPDRPLRQGAGRSDLEAHVRVPQSDFGSSDKNRFGFSARSCLSSSARPATRQMRAEPEWIVSREVRRKPG
jgi:hypothetical protein